MTATHARSIAVRDGRNRHECRAEKSRTPVRRLRTHAGVLTPVWTVGNSGPTDTPKLQAGHAGRKCLLGDEARLRVGICTPLGVRHDVYFACLPSPYP